MIRVEFLKYLAGMAVLTNIPKAISWDSSAKELRKQNFGDDFHWGIGTSAYQIEGAFDQDGKGESIWDRFSAQSGHIKDNSNGNIAIDFYHRYESDLMLLKRLNFKNFRFSFSWSRILPEGMGRINEKGIDFYNRMIDKCLELGIEPWAMLYHWDLPQMLEERGGWVNRDIVDWFSAYADLCSRRFGDRIKHWMVLNEPLGFTSLGYLAGIHAPNRTGIGKFLAAVHHTALCQAEGGRIIRHNVKRGHVGTTFSCSYIEPEMATDRYQRSAKRLDALLNRLFIEPSLGMGYPWEDLPLLRRIEKHIQPGDLDQLSFDFDYIGLQNYFRVVTKPGLIPFIWANRVKPGEHAETTEMGWEVYPDGMYHIIKQFANYPIKEIIITENGAAFPDIVENDKVHDLKRIQFFEKYLLNVLKAKEEGANVKGYFVWTFIDNFEWAEGFRPRFGLVYNDFRSQQRTIKDSGYWFRDFLK